MYSPPSPQTGNKKKMRPWLICLGGILRREFLRFLRQRGRFLAALARPLVWLFIFAAGFRATLGLSVIAPYDTYISYETYIAPGLVGVILLFSGMQGSLAMVYDREMGAMRVLLTAPFPRWYLLFCKLLAVSLVACAQCYVFLLIAAWWDVRPPWGGYFFALPAVLLAGFMLGALGLALSSAVRQMENFAGVMNFVIFPLFFASSALYPLWRIRESSPLLAKIAAANPFTHAVELVRFALYQQWNPRAFFIVAGCALAFFLLAAVGYDPKRGFLRRPLRGG
jgi:ABC-2 type transport system permease protein